MPAALRIGFTVVQMSTCREESYNGPALYPQQRNAGPSKMVPRKLGRGLVLLKRVPAQGLAKCHLSQTSQSLFTSGITSRHRRCALELSCHLMSPSLPVFPRCFQQVSSRVLISGQPLFTCLSLLSDTQSPEARDGVLINFHLSRFRQESCGVERYLVVWEKVRGTSRACDWRALEMEMTARLQAVGS